MGRPINKRNFGLLANADDTRFAPANDTFFNLTINVQVGTNSETATGYIIKQRSTRKFLVNDLKTGTKLTPSGSGTGNVGICTLVDKADGSLGANEMSIMGQIAATGEQVRIKKLYNRTCRDFSDNRYKWEIQDDSSATLLVLTAI